MGFWAVEKINHTGAETPPKKSAAELAREKATDFLRTRIKGLKNAERMIDLGVRGPQKVLEEALDQLNVDSKQPIVLKTLGPGRATATCSQLVPRLHVANHTTSRRNSMT